MARYYDNDTAQPHGDHEVHRAACDWLPRLENPRSPGHRANCRTAVAAARGIYPRANGGYHRSRDCHTA